MSNDTLKQFPDVNPDDISSAGRQFKSAASDLVTASGKVRSVAGTTSWQSTQARPAWDSEVQGRQSDLANAHDVADHVGNVLHMTGSEVAKSKSDYESATFMMLYTPDPRVLSGGTLKDLLDPTPKPVDQKALQEYLALVHKANKAVDDAEFLLAVCARELMAVSSHVTFAPLPGGTPPNAVDPKTNVIIPFSPAFGAPSGAIYANGIPVQLAHGQKFEGNILRELGIDDQTKAFFRPGKDGAWTLPRTKSGLFRGSFPDSVRAGVLEIKSGTTEITMKSPQMQVQRWISRTLGRPMNMITERDTPIDPEVQAAVEESGGGIYARVPGEESIFYDRINDQYVRLEGGQGPGNNELAVHPVPEDEVSKIDAAERNAMMRARFGPEDDNPPKVEGPNQPYTTQQEYDDAWGKADISPDGDTPLPGTSDEDIPGEPIEPVAPGEEPVEPVEPILPEGPEIFEEIIP